MAMSHADYMKQQQMMEQMAYMQRQSMANQYMGGLGPSQPATPQPKKEASDANPLLLLTEGE